jgi:hypothetical protein
MTPPERERWSPAEALGVQLAATQLLMVLAYGSIGFPHGGFFAPCYGLVMALGLPIALVLGGDSDPMEEVAFAPGLVLVALAVLAWRAARRAAPQVMGHLALFVFNFASAGGMWLAAAIAVPGFPP